MTSLRPSALLLGAALLSLAACGAPKGRGDATSVPARAGWADRESVGKAIAFLNEGSSDRAREVLARLLNQKPDDAIARGLIAQIDSDPMTLLGRASFAYKVRQGDTLSLLAGRFLGDPTRFYALGRYNGLTFPVTLSAGQSLRIPGIERTLKPKPVPRPAAAEPPRIKITPSPPLVARPVADPARAAKLRAVGLEALNRGNVAQAIALLRQAQQAAPDNPLIQRDLVRATRIQRAVQTKRQ